MENKHQMMTIKETNKIMQFLQGLVEGFLVTAFLNHLVVSHLTYIQRSLLHCIF